MNIEKTSASKTAILNINTASSITKDIDAMIKQYAEYITAETTNANSGFFKIVMARISEGVEIRKQFNAINEKCLQVIDLVTKSKPDLPDDSTEYNYNPDLLIAYAYYCIGHAYVLRSKFSEAKAQFIKSLEVFPNPEAQYFIGLVLEEEGKKQETISAFQKVIADFPDSELAIEANKQLASPEKICSGRKKWLIALILSVFLGFTGADSFYLGHIKYGFLKLITLGGCGIGYLLDIIFILSGLMRDSKRQRLI